VSERLIQTNDGSTTFNNIGTPIAQYAYDPFGRRIKKTILQATTPGTQTGTTIYFYAGEGLIAEVDGNSSGGTITVSYGWQPNGSWGTAPNYKRDHAGQSGAVNSQGSAAASNNNAGSTNPTNTANGVEHLYHHDHLGTPIRLTNQAGETTWRAVSEAFGRTTIDTAIAPITTGTTTNHLRFPGQYEDPETGTHYNWNRDYLPYAGRYVQTDPIGLGGGINTYGFVQGKPLRYRDSRGLTWALEFPEYEPPGDTCWEGVRRTTRPSLRRIKLQGEDDDNTPHNAVLHCVGTCRLQKECGSVQRFIVSYGHELVAANPPNREVPPGSIFGYHFPRYAYPEATKNDLHNNNVGLACALDQSCEKTDCISCCLSKLGDGTLKYGTGR
jgi:RHS repeat-associated protein